MEYVFRDLVTKCWWSWLALLAAVICTAVLAASPAISDVQQGWLAIAAYVSLAIFFAYPLKAAAYAGHRHLLTVCIWSFVLVLLGIALWYYAFYRFAGADSTKYDKLLNVVPVFVAIWAAACGWLVHFRLSTKAHRTNNAFGILMEMRKSGEFLSRYLTVTKHFPFGLPTIPREYHDYFPTAKLKELTAAAQAAGKEVDQVDKERVEAIAALRYMLNYFEFMAVGIKAGDLDEDLLYDTISTSVVSIYERCQPMIDYVRGPLPAGGGQPLAFIAMEALVYRWTIRLNNDKAAHANKKNGGSGR